jgi:hypothetical protein
MLNHFFKFIIQILQRHSRFQFYGVMLLFRFPIEYSGVNWATYSPVPADILPYFRCTKEHFCRWVPKAIGIEPAAIAFSYLSMNDVSGSRFLVLLSLYLSIILFIFQSLSLPRLKPCATISVMPTAFAKCDEQVP